MDAALDRAAALRALRARAAARFPNGFAFASASADAPRLAALLADVVPTGDAARALLGAALRLHPATLGALADGDLSPVVVDRDRVVALARVLGLDEPTFFTVLRVEIAAYVGGAPRRAAGDAPLESKRLEAEFREAWAYAEADQAEVDAAGAQDEDDGDAEPGEESGPGDAGRPESAPGRFVHWRTGRRLDGGESPG